MNDTAALRALLAADPLGDDLVMAALFALPALLDKADALAALVAAKDAQERSLGLQPITDGKPGSVTAAFDRARRLVEDER